MLSLFSPEKSTFETAAIASWQNEMRMDNASEIVRLLAPGGLLLYETFTLEQQALPYGPSNPEYLLAPGELPRLFADLDIVRHEELREGRPRPDAIARLIARKPAGR